MSDTLIERANSLAAYLNDNCLIGEAVDRFDILDSLASIGLKLVEDTEGLSTVAYYTAVKRAVTLAPQPPNGGEASDGMSAIK